MKPNPEQEKGGSGTCETVKVLRNGEVFTINKTDFDEKVDQLAPEEGATTEAAAETTSAPARKRK